MSIMFQFQCQEDEVHVVISTSSFEASNVVTFQEELDKVIPHETSRFVLDMEKVTMIDSFAIGTLLKLKKMASGEHGVKLIGVKPSVISVLEMLRLHKVFDVELSESASVAQ